MKITKIKKIVVQIILILILILTIVINMYSISYAKYVFDYIITVAEIKIEYE